MRHVFGRVSALGSDPEIQAHFARYLCVLASGFLEVSVRSILTEYSKSRAVPEIANFVEESLDEFQNPKMQKILDWLRCFSAVWADEVERKTNGQLKDSVDSIVANRHQIAHGASVGVTPARVRAFYEDAVKVVEMIEGVLGM